MPAAADSAVTLSPNPAVALDSAPLVLLPLL
jgi:hypothetical protein